MKTLQMHQEFPTALSELLSAREDRYNHLDQFPELKNVTVVKDEREGDVVVQERHILLTESLPAVIHPFLPGGKLQLVETSRFDPATNMHSFVIVPDTGLEHLFRIEGFSKYYAEDENRSARDYDIKIQSTVFLAGNLIEGTIYELYRNSLESDKNSLLSYMKMKKQPGTPHE